MRHFYYKLDVGHLGEVGNSGSKLSGGQKHRVALARALYARPSIYLLDDVFAGLDSRTAELVFHHVLGPGGFAKRHGATAILATSSAQYLHAADYTVSLNADGICEARNISRAPKTLDAMDEANEESRLEQTAREQSSEESPSKKTSHVGTVSTVNTDLPMKTTAVCVSVHEDAGSDMPIKKNDSFAMYKYYLSACEIAPLLLFFGLATLYAFAYNFSTAWLSFWTQDRFEQDRGFYFGKDTNVSFKDNIDPYDECTHEECLAVLGVTGLLGLIAREGSIDSMVRVDGLSNGEAQLLGLARAVLRKQQQERSRAPLAAQEREKKSAEKADADSTGGILILDEIGSTVDEGTYQTMWEIIRQEFCDFTVVAVVHRINREVLEIFDNVVVMDNGEVVEAGSISDSM
ncbi:Putative ABC transporter-like, ATP-binding domain-containing protein [Septoria linicola]|uniref:ABC transporter-like, ATP-binding domain-containing protein n=1 Tax=Septoria linicola TaxID=215465 RepID=A0A9Q9EIL3_9PEZI|nr:putative ABC transporter-like, ATP-binding domain-containing protein [Septoria linicola]USW52906.1 Putative ABC transporter-like, ATP-binding domain-containing protein [Septoria linicola]